MRRGILIIGGLVVAVVMAAVFVFVFSARQVSVPPQPLPQPPMPSTPPPNTPRPPDFLPQMPSPPPGPASPSSPLPSAPSRPDTPAFDSQRARLAGAKFSEAVSGQVLYNPPTRMRIEETERVEVRIAPSDYIGDIRADLVGKGVPRVESIEITAVMRARLQGSGFHIQPSLGEPQAILPGRLTQWNFDVTPTRSGKQTLELEISYLVRTDSGTYPSSLPPFRRDIDVEISAWHAIGASVAEHRELAISTAVAVMLGLIGFFLKLWYMERRTRKLKAVGAASSPPPRSRKKKRR